MSLQHELAALGELPVAEQHGLDEHPDVLALRADNALFHQVHDRAQILESIARRAHMRSNPPRRVGGFAFACAALLGVGAIAAMSMYGRPAPSASSLTELPPPQCDLKRHYPRSDLGERGAQYTRDMLACMKRGRQEIQSMVLDTSIVPPRAFSYACEQGFGSACYHLGLFHLSGPVGFQGPDGRVLAPSDDFERRLLAARFFERGCVLDEPLGCCALGNMLEEDAPIRVHLRLESAPWFKRADRLAPETCVRYGERDGRHPGKAPPKLPRKPRGAQPTIDW